MNREQTVRFWNSDLGRRIPSAIVMLIAIIGISYWGGTLLLLLSIALSGLLFYEWVMIVKKTTLDTNSVAVSAVFALSLVLIFFNFNLIAFLLLLVFAALIIVVNTGEERIEVSWLVGGAIYASIPALTFLLTRGHYPGIFGGSFALLMFLYLTVWATDIFAYFAGRAFGGPKLLPVVSPKKTWSGALGGFAGAVGIGVIYVLSVDGFGATTTLMLAGVLSIVSQVGDLFESWVKRYFNVKDSSQLIPGHGGFLDRVDGLVAAAVPVAVVLILTSN